MPSSTFRLSLRKPPDMLPTLTKEARALSEMRRLIERERMVKLTAAFANLPRDPRTMETSRGQ